MHKLSRMVLVILVGLAFFSGVTLVPQAAGAATDRRDLEVMARSMGFLAGVKRGEVVLGVVVDPTIEASRAEATSVRESVEAGISAAALEFSSKDVPVDRIDELSGIDLILVTDGLVDHHSKIFEAASRRGILTVSTDERCVDSGKCVMWVQGSPSVRIVVNKQAASESSIRFQTSFRLLVTER